MTPRAGLCAFVVSVLAFSTVALAGSGSSGPPLVNWSAPATYTPSTSSSRIRALADVTNPLPFVGVTPCRIVDTRGPAGTFGGPSLPASTPRNFPLPAGPCAGIPTSVSAYSLNITVTNTLGPGFISIYPQGGAVPLVSTLNYLAGQTLANAAIVPAGTSGGVTVIAGVSGTDLIIDINGYYAAAAGNQGNSFKVVNNFSLFPAAAIWGETLSTVNAMGVYGLASASSGSATGVWGATKSNDNGAAGLVGIADASTGGTSGVVGTSNSNSSGASGVRGFLFSSAGGSAGVRGVIFGGLVEQSYSISGVRGESIPGYGVLGISQATGVGAALLDVSNVQLVYALLAAQGPINYAVFAGGDFGGTGAKYFVEPHLTDASKVIRYVSLEGPEAGTYFRGRGRFEHGQATIQLPEDFRMVTDSEGLSIQVTPIGEFATVAVLQIDLDGIVVKASRNVEFFYTVNGVRKTHKHLKPVGPGNEFVPQSAEAKMPAHLTEGQKSMLISNGTYNADGTINMETAERLGWTKTWADREAQAQAAVRDTQKAASAKQR